MTFAQLQYIIAVDTFRHFALAAQHCFISQPTLSMQIRKAEDKLGFKIFDRSAQPVIPTEAGAELIQQARKIMTEKSMLDDMINLRKGVIAGELKIGIIPTLAPYLLPLFVQRFTTKYPKVKLVVIELTTDTILSQLRAGRIDLGILVTPLHEHGIKEYPLFYEELMAYVSKKNAAFKKTYMLPQDLDPNKLWLLEEGHCFRSQIVNLCELKKASREASRVDYEAGSIETLRRMVEMNDGVTILPELATYGMTNKQLSLIRYFRRPAPMREVSIIVHRDFVKKKLIDILRTEIVASIPEKVKLNAGKYVVPLSVG